MYKIVLTAATTLLGGVGLLLTTQIVARFIADPLVEFRRLLSEIAYTLILYSKYLHNPAATGSTPEFQDARDQCRKLASRLPASAGAVLGYDFLARHKFVPPLTNVKDAAASLIGLSNTTENTPPDHTGKRYEKIAEHLGIYVE